MTLKQDVDVEASKTRQCDVKKTMSSKNNWKLIIR